MKLHNNHGIYGNIALRYYYNLSILKYNLNSQAAFFCCFIYETRLNFEIAPKHSMTKVTRIDRKHNYIELIKTKLPKYNRICMHVPSIKHV